MTKEEVLQKCTVEGTIVKLPAGQLGRKLYMEVANSLSLIGGKWKGKPVFGFVFPEDPTDLLEQIANGENRNIKKEYQFFATPSELADELVELAEITEDDEVLEPSAGQGAIVKAVHRVFAGKTVWGYELMPINQTFLSKIAGFRLLGDDFLKECDTSYDKIVANPPFAKNADVDHIRKMYDCLKDKGRLVSISSKHWQMSQNKKELQFQGWLKKVKATVKEIDPGTFKESGTMVGGLIIIINKK